MKNLIILITAIISFSTFGQAPVLNKDIDVIEPFHTVFINARYNVYLKQSNEISIEARALKEVLDITTFEVKDDALYVNIKRENKDKSLWEQIDDIKIAPKLDLYISMKEVKGIHINGSGRLRTDNSIASDSIKLAVSGNGQLEADLKGDYVAIELTGGGLIKLSGYANTADILLSGYGKIESYPLELKSAEAIIAGSGDAEITVSDQLEATINGSGSLYHKGETKKVTKYLNGAGNIMRKY